MMLVAMVSKKLGKGAFFLNLPPVLTIVLKRFEFNMELMRFVKVHDSHMFPTELSLNEFLVKENGDVDDKDEQSKNAEYFLHSVLVHPANYLKQCPPTASHETKGINGGRVFVIMKPTLCHSQYNATEQSGQLAYIYFRLAPFLLQTPAVELFGSTKITFYGNLSDFGLRPLEIHIVDERLRSIRKFFFQHHR